MVRVDPRVLVGASLVVFYDFFYELSSSPPALEITRILQTRKTFWAVDSELFFDQGIKLEYTLCSSMAVWYHVFWLLDPKIGF